MGFGDFTIPPALYPEVLGENYDEQVVEKIRQNPIGWLNSLPMTEYAHVLLVITAHNFGGAPKQYLELAWNRLLIPILTRYYMELEKYRFWKAAKTRVYMSHLDVWQYPGWVTLRADLCTCTAKVRSAMRLILGSWGKLVNRPYDDPAVVKLCALCRRFTTDFELDKWIDELENGLSEIPDPGMSGEGNPGTENTEDPDSSETPSDGEEDQESGPSSCTCQCKLNCGKCAQ